MKQKLIGIVGPTASGKTGIGVALAKALNGEVISADSMQLYRGIHIASAAPDLEERDGIEHHLIEILSEDECCTVAEYVTMARQKIEEVFLRGRQPIVVGGTGLYINALFDHTQFFSEAEDPVVRGRLEEEYETVGAEALLSRLQEIDPETAARLHPNDRRRIVRALEVFEKTGQTLTALNEQSHGEELPYDVVLIGLTYRDRERLYERINKRVDLMLEAGLLEEARSTFGRVGTHGMSQAIGHKELYAYFEGDKTLEEAAESLKQATRRYAKRQLTWFRRDERIHWIEMDETKDALDEILKIIHGKEETA